MDRNVPRTFIDVLLNWLMKSFVCAAGVVPCHFGIS